MHETDPRIISFHGVNYSKFILLNLKIIFSNIKSYKMGEREREREKDF
jgi:hypothetical protein